MAVTVGFGIYRIQVLGILQCCSKLASGVLLTKVVMTCVMLQACGDFSVAAILKAALDEAESSSDAEDWVLLASS